MASSMAYSGIYIIPSPGGSLETSNTTLATLTRNLKSVFPSTQPPPTTEHWSLHHRLLRSRDDPARPALKPKCHHIFHTSFLTPDRAYAWVDKLAPAGAPASDQGSIVTIPAASIDSHTRFLAEQCGADWSPGAGTRVENGSTFRIGLYAVRVGVLQSSRPGPTQANLATTLSPGVILCITTHGGGLDGLAEMSKEERAEVVEFRQKQIRALATTILPEASEAQLEALLKGSGQSDAKEKAPVPQGQAQNTLHEIMQTLEGNKADGESFEARCEIVRMWCTALRTRH